MQISSDCNDDDDDDFPASGIAQIKSSNLHSFPSSVVSLQNLVESEDWII